MPTISKLEIVALIYRVPEGRAYGMARGLTSIGQASLLKLTTDDGVEGIGEASGPPSITKAYLDLIAPYFIGRVWNASGSHQDVNDHAHTNGGQRRALSRRTVLRAAALGAMEASADLNKPT